MNVIEHGKWEIYVPSVLPENAPSSALFARRESDGQDWYDYVNPPATNFATDTVKFMAIWRDYAYGYVVGPAVYDATLLWPPGHLVWEITDYVGNDPQADFGNKLYNPDTGEFTDQGPHPAPVSPSREMLLKQLQSIATVLGVKIQE